MPFTHPVPDWNAQGAEPPESLKTAGWGINQKPPADYFNWFFYNSAKAIIELQMNAIHTDQKGVASGVATLDASGKVPASQLNVSAPPDATTSTKGVVQLSNSTTSTSETLAATPKAVKDAKDGLSAQIGILSGLNTTAKDNLVSAVNELFTFANDGKTKWSSVIGSPLVSGDTFAQMQTKTQTIKNTLATNLTAKGQSSAGTETLKALVDKVASVNTGKKWAEGTLTTPASTFSITGLGFKPSMVYYYVFQSGGGLTAGLGAAVNPAQLLDPDLGMAQNQFIYRTSSYSRAYTNAITWGQNSVTGLSTLANASIKYFVFE